MVKMLRKTKKVIAAALTAGMLMGAVSTPVAAATEGWKKDATGWWYQNANGSYPKNKWEKINGAWYYFDARGYMLANSWVKDNGKWYYVGSTGAMKANDWVREKSGEWYYLGADGVMEVNSWVRGSSDKWYYVDNKGIMKENDWVSDNGKWYYMGADGVMKTDSWIKDGSGKQYYMGNDGIMIGDSVGTTYLGNLTFKADQSWKLEGADNEEIIYEIPSSDENIVNNFMATMTKVEDETSENYLEDMKEDLIQEFQQMGIKLVAEGKMDTPYGTAISLTMDATTLVESFGVEGYSVYLKQVIFMNDEDFYIFQISCVGEDFTTIEPQFDAMIASISK